MSGDLTFSEDNKATSEKKDGRLDFANTQDERSKIASDTSQITFSLPLPTPPHLLPPCPSLQTSII